MKNWLVETLEESGMTPSKAADVINASDDELSLYLVHPGLMTLNEIGMLARSLPKESAKLMLNRIVKVFAL